MHGGHEQIYEPLCSFNPDARSTSLKLTIETPPPSIRVSRGNLEFGHERKLDLLEPQCEQAVAEVPTIVQLGKPVVDPGKMLELAVLMLSEFPMVNRA